VPQPSTLGLVREHYFFLAVEDGDDLPGLSSVIDPLPNGRVLLLKPSERSVIVPEPNFRVFPVTVLPFLSRSVVIDPLPNGRVSVVVPFDHCVIVPEPRPRVVPVIVLPVLSRSVVMEPLPKGRVVLLEPSDRSVIVPEPNFRVVPVRGLLIEPLGESSAKEPLAASTTTRETTKNNAKTLTIFCPCGKLIRFDSTVGDCTTIDLGGQSTCQKSFRRSLRRLA
jgi:hypothetical protein